MNKKLLLLMLIGFSGHASSLTCESEFTPINSIQGTAAQSPMVGQVVNVQGVVTGDFRGKNNLSGYFIQQSAVSADKASSGLFVHSNDINQAIAIGDLVALTGSVAEQFEVTQLTQVSNTTVCQKNSKLPDPVLLTMPLNGFDLEQVEGMRVGFAQAVVVSDLYQYIKYGEMTVSSELLMAPTSVQLPGHAAKRQADINATNQLIIDDGKMGEFSLPMAVGGDGKNPISANNVLALGQSLNVVGVMHYAFGQYKLQPTTAVEFAREKTHKLIPKDPGGGIKVASFNIENFFVSLDGGEENCGPLQNFGCRGADSVEEYQRQLVKLVKAINTANASVMGLQELENNESSAEVLVNALNEDAGSNKWSFINTGILGGDVIKVGIIFQPALVTPMGEYALLNAKTNPEFKEDKHRVAVMQTFKTQHNQMFNLATAHFKSKSCRDAQGLNSDQHDGQGCYNPARVEVARQIAQWLNSNPTQQGVNKTVFIGDLNSYQKEDPIETLKQAGYINLAERYLGMNNWTTSYRGQVGSLDYIMVNQAAAALSTGLTQWHINSTEMHEFGYDLESLNESVNKPKQFYLSTPFSSSDHDLVLAGFNW